MRLLVAVAASSPSWWAYSARFFRAHSSISSLNRPTARSSSSCTAVVGRGAVSCDGGAAAPPQFDVSRLYYPIFHCRGGRHSRDTPPGAVTVFRQPSSLLVGLQTASRLQVFWCLAGPMWPTRRGFPRTRVRLGPLAWASALGRRPFGWLAGLEIVRSQGRRLLVRWRLSRWFIGPFRAPG